MLFRNSEVDALGYYEGVSDFGSGQGGNKEWFAVWFAVVLAAWVRPGCGSAAGHTQAVKQTQRTHS